MAEEMLTVLKYCAENDIIESSASFSNHKSHSMQSYPEDVVMASNNEGVLAKSRNGHPIHIFVDQTPKPICSRRSSSSSSRSAHHFRENLALDADESDGWETVTSDEDDEEPHQPPPAKNSKQEESSVYIGISVTSRSSEDADSINNSCTLSEWNVGGLIAACELIFQLLDLIETERQARVDAYCVGDAKERRFFSMSGPIIMGAIYFVS